jgi:hypothetical protein
MACKKRKTSTPLDVLTRGDDQPTDLPKGWKRLETLYKNKSNFPVAGDKYRRHKLTFPDCSGFDAVKNSSCPSQLNLKDSIKFPKIRRIKVMRMRAAYNDTNDTDLNQVAWIFTEADTLNNKMDDMDSTDGTTKTIPDFNPSQLGVNNDAMYIWSNGIDFLFNKKGAPENIKLSHGHIDDIVEIDRLQPCGRTILEPFFYVFFYRNGTGPTPGGDEYRILIDYELTDVTLETLWIRQQNYEKYKPENLRWSLRDDTYATLSANMGTWGAAAEVDPA